MGKVSVQGSEKEETFQPASAEAGVPKVQKSVPRKDRRQKTEDRRQKIEETERAKVGS
jgi:hypothetical protein